MIYVFIGLAFACGFMSGMLCYVGFSEKYSFPNHNYRTLHKLLDQHMNNINRQK